MPGKKTEKVVKIDTKVKGDIFDNLEEFRLRQDFEDATGVDKPLITVPIRKPNRQDFIRVHPNENYHMSAPIFEAKEDRENYLITRGLLHEFPDEIIPKMLYTAINRQGVLFLWPVRLDDKAGKLDSWNRSAHKGAKEAMTQWVRIASSRSLGAYDVFIAKGNLSDPEWPDVPFNEIIRIAFGDYIIKTNDHPVLKKLRGLE